MTNTPDPRDVALGLAAGGGRVGLAAGRVALAPARLAMRAPVIGTLARRATADLAREGARARERARDELELELNRIIGAVLDHEMTERVVERALASPGLERVIVRVLESHLVDELVERVLVSPELDRVMDYVATSPQIVQVVTQQTQTLAGEMVSDVRRRTHRVDDVAERTVRGLLRRPRPGPS